MAIDGLPLLINGKPLDVIVRDAQGYAFEKERADILQRVLWAAAESHGGMLRVRHIALDAYHSGKSTISMEEDRQSRDMIVTSQG